MDALAVSTIARDFGPAGVLGVIVIVLFLRSQYLSKELEKKADDKYNEEQHNTFRAAIASKAGNKLNEEQHTVFKESIETSNLLNTEQHRQFSISLNEKMDKEWCQRMHGNLVASFNETRKNIREDVKTLHEKLDRLK